MDPHGFTNDIRSPVLSHLLSPRSPGWALADNTPPTQDDIGSLGTVAWILPVPVRGESGHGIWVFGDLLVLLFLFLSFNKCVPRKINREEVEGE